MVTSRYIKMISVLVLLTLTVSTAAPDFQDIHRLGYKEMLGYGAHMKTSTLALTSITGSEQQYLHNLVRFFSDPVQILSAAAALQTTYNVTDMCANQTLYLLHNAGKNWAMTMLDSWGKPETGILHGNLNWLGAYDECLNITIPANTASLNLNFKPQYCTLNTKLAIGSMSAGLHIGMCVPSGCANTTILSIIEGTLHLLHKSANHTTAANTKDTVICQDTDKTLDTGAVVTIVIVVLIAVICLVASVYDIWTQHSLSYTPLRHYCKNGAANGSTATINESEAGPDSETTPLVKHPDELKAVEHGLAAKILLCFSLYTNGGKILSTEQSPGAITCLHGIRFLSMTWVILGHTGAFSVLLLGNPTYSFTWIYRLSFQAVANASVAVDTFFVLSGLLAAYVFLRDFEKRNTTLRQFLRDLPKLFSHRYIRLTPAYGFGILIWTCLIWYIYDGPMWPNYHRTMDDRCQRHWYFNFLYINNLFHSDDECFGWSWYLANDMQFFIISPFIVYWMWRHFLSGFITLIVMITGSVSSSIAVAYKQDAGLDFNVLVAGDVDTYDEYYYAAPWCRFHTFGVGIFVGYVLWWSKGKLRMSQIVNIALWLVAAGLCLAVIYGPYSAESGGHNSTRAERAVYNSMGRTAWSVGVAYVIIACHTGHGGPVNKLLSWPGFVPVSKLTYCAYLLHPIVIWIIVRGTRYTYIYTDLTYITTFLIYFIMAYMAAFPFSLTFEAPIMGLDKLLFAPPKRKNMTELES